MNKRFTRLAAVAAVSALGLPACSGGKIVTATSASSGASAAANAYTCPAGKLVGGGASSQKLAIDTLISDYSKQCGAKATIEYSSTGSGAGIKDFYNSQTDWAGSDSALKTVENSDKIIEADQAKARCGGNAALNLPLVISPVAFSYNVEGVTKLTLTPSIINDITFGKVVKWNDPKIIALNPSVTLPDLAISVFFRSDESGTTENMTKFLKEASPSNFAGKTGKKWPGTVGEGKKGTQGVAEGVKATKGGFGYMEWKFATDSKLGVAAIDNGAGAVELTAGSVAKGLGGAKIAGTDNDLSLSLAYTGTATGAYPAIMVTYEIVCSKGLPADKNAILKDFLAFVASADEQAALVEKGYGPLPANLRARVAEAIKSLS